MVKRSVLIAALLVAILGALGIASATEDSGQTPETVVVPPVVVMPRNEPQDTPETRADVFTSLRTAPVKMLWGVRKWLHSHRRKSHPGRDNCRRPGCAADGYGDRTGRPYIHSTGHRRSHFRESAGSVF